MAMDDLLDNLNEDQLAAVTHETGPLLVFAGAGSGKTRVITCRIAWLMRERHVPPDRFLAMTFTNKASEEMKHRVQTYVGEGPHWMGTFHSVCLRLLRIYGARLGLPGGFVVYDDGDSEVLLRRILREQGLGRERFAGVASWIDRLKNDGVLEPPEPESRQDAECAAVMKAYQEALRAAGAVDFGDLLCLTAQLLREHEDVRLELAQRFEHILVDEFQDTNLVQYEIVRLLLNPQRDICVVGDDDQSIYSWRGARVSNILDFVKDFPDATVVTLRNNYRSRTPILRAATQVVSRNVRRREKTLLAVRGGGEPVLVHGAFDEVQEAAFVVRNVARALADGTPPSRVAVFFRTNAQSRVFEDAMRNRGIPHRVVGAVRFYQRKEVKDVLSYLRLLVNPTDEVALSRVLDVPPRGLGEATLARAREMAAALGLPLLFGLAHVGDASGKVMGARVRQFVELISDLALLAREADAEVVVRQTLARTGYLEWLGRDETPEALSRVENVNELVASVSQWMAMSGKRDLASYLDQVALVQPLDEAEGGEAVSLMTVHAAKGLEFDVVFVTGLEDGLFPLGGPAGRGNSSRDELEEERRLMYVAMTRARERLYLTYAYSRMRYGQVRPGRPSRFLNDLPRSLVRVVS